MFKFNTILTIYQLLFNGKLLYMRLQSKVKVCTGWYYWQLMMELLSAEEQTLEELTEWQWYCYTAAELWRCQEIAAALDKDQDTVNWL